MDVNSCNDRYSVRRHWLFVHHVTSFLGLSVVQKTVSSFSPYSPRPVAIPIFMSLAWQADNGGLYIGKFFGKKKCFVAVSPNKTIQGLYGAYLMA